MARMDARTRLYLQTMETQITRDCVNGLIVATYEKNQSYSYAAGYLESFATELIMQLPKAKREQYRAQLVQAAQNVNS